MDNRELVYECHLNTMNGEMEYARKKGDDKWLRKRVREMRAYLNDPFLPVNLREKVEKLIEKWEI